MLGRVIQLVPPAHLPDALVALRPSLLQLAASSAASAGGEAQCLHAAHAWAALVASSAAGVCPIYVKILLAYFAFSSDFATPASILIIATPLQSRPHRGPN